MKKLYSCMEAAIKLKIDDSRVRQLIRAGRLPAQKVGRSWIIDPADLELVKDRKPGRPKKIEEVHVDEDMLTGKDAVIVSTMKLKGEAKLTVDKIPEGTMPVSVFKQRRERRKRKLEREKRKRGKK